MKKFLSGFLAGAMVFATVGALAVSYVAVPAEFKVLVNGKEFTSDPPALVVEGRTYLPLRAIGDALGIPVNWNDELGQAEVGNVASNEKSAYAEIDNAIQENDKWKMTYLNYKTTKNADEYTEAADGKEFLLVFFEIENTSSETQNFSLINLDCYIDDFKTPQRIIATRIDDAAQLASTSVEPGKKAKGYLAFEVSSEWKKAEVSYNEDLLKKDNENILKFTLTK